MNREEAYTIRSAVRMGFQAPFLHILAAVWVITFWKTLALADLPIAIILGYPLAIVTFLFITHIVITTKLTDNGHICEVHATERGVMLLAMDVTSDPSRVVGMVGVKPLSASHALLVRFIVRTPYRCMGIGKGLMEAAFQFATDEGYGAIEAETWDVATEFKLFPMYAKQGFRKHRALWAPFWWMPMYRAEILIKDLTNL